MKRKYRYTGLFMFLLTCSLFQLKAARNFDKSPATLIESSPFGSGWRKITVASTLDSTPQSAGLADYQLFPNSDLYVIREKSATPCHLYTACNKARDKKYFFESRWDDSHADDRFYKRNLTDAEHVFYLKDMVKAWSVFTTLNDIVSWINHGALLSWYWNKELFPWDKDLDFQMTFYDMLQLSTEFNQTMVDDRFLLDINPNFMYRARQLQNVIDARFIDTVSGLYIDITALSSNSPLINDRVICCKSPHCYTHDQLFPLHVMALEGYRLYRPNNVLRNLIEEYEEGSLHKVDYNKHIFNGTKWVAKTVKGL